LLNQVIGFLCLDGTWWLRSYEKALIDTASQQLTSENKKLLDIQLSSLFYVHRQHKGRIARLHYVLMNQVPRMDMPADYGLARILVKSAGGSTWVSVGTDTGHFFFSTVL
jgi:hypothetical protein